MHANDLYLCLRRRALQVARIVISCVGRRSGGAARLRRSDISFAPFVRTWHSQNGLRCIMISSGFDVPNRPPHVITAAAHDFTLPSMTARRAVRAR